MRGKGSRRLTIVALSAALTSLLLWACAGPAGMLEEIEQTVAAAAEGSVETPPAAATDLTAESSGTTTVDLAWTDVDGEVTYQLQRRVAGNEEWGDAAAEIGADSTTHTDTGLTPETRYEYRLRARNGAGDSDWSEVAAATTGALPTYTVTYHGNGHDSGTVPVDENEYLKGETVTVSGSSDLAKIGEYFVGWNTQENGFGIQYHPSDPLVVQSSDIRLYAQWSASIYQLTVVSEMDGTIVAPAMSPVNVAHGAETTITAAPDAGFGLNEWVVDDGSATIAEPNSESTTVILTAGDTTIRATYVDTQPPDAPSAPDLLAEDDSGSSHVDNITRQTSSLSFVGTAEPLSTVELFSSHDGSLGTVAVDEFGNWAIDCSLSSQATAHDLRATATDALGNTSAESDSLDVVVDTTPPTPSILTSFHSDDFNEITVAWTNSQDAHENRLWWTPEDGDGNVILGSSYESFTATSLVDGVNYAFYLASIDVAGNEEVPDALGAQAPEEGMIRWSFDPGENVNDCTTPAVGADGTVYVGTHQGILYALDPDDGSVDWTFSAGDQIHGAPAIADSGIIYITSEDGYVYAVNPTTHNANWSFDTGSPIRHGVAIDTAGDIWVASGLALFKLSDTSGSELLSRDITGESIRTTPVVGVDGGTYLGVNAGASISVYSISESQTIVYSNSDIDSIYTDFAVDDMGNLYFGTSSGLVSLTGGNLQDRWIFEPHWNVPPVYSTPVVGTDGTVFVGSLLDDLHALDPSDGSVKWSHDTGDVVKGGPVIGANGDVYIMSDNGEGLFALNAFTGALQWSETWAIVKNHNDGVSSILHPNATLLIPDTGFYGTGLAAVWTRSGGPAVSPWPMYGYDLANSSRAPE